MRRITLRSLFASLAGLALVACGGGGGGGGGGAVSVVFTTFQPAATVIGQADFTSNMFNQGGAAAANTVGLPGAPCQVGARLYIPDLFNHRVLGYNSVPSAANAPADFVIGQADFVTTSINTGGRTGATLGAPWAVCASGGKFFVSEDSNNRVLIFNTVPTATGATADVALGQVDLTTGANGGGPAGIFGPAGLHAVGTKLLVCDLGNHRVLIWNTIPTTHGTNADLVLGQADFAALAANRGLANPTAGSLNQPAGVWSDGTRLVVADAINHRVLIWNTFPTTNGQAADIVLGQPNFTTATPTTTMTGMNEPTDVTSDGTRLIVGDSGNNRILIFDAFPAASVTAATTVLGQGDFTHGTANDDDQDNASDAGPTSRTLNTSPGTSFVKLLGQRLFFGDHQNGRCLIYEAQ